ncbi:unnamed protein product [Pleuronectes platessa]|uniref:Uncharacterized protein n=1 Tax=Pleuronectes platessa TaxID=8262 RepID=A0A9N7YGM7_PLEPL|nr:unnamed protein product [Pleuronectes platessa]
MSHDTRYVPNIDRTEEDKQGLAHHFSLYEAVCLLGCNHKHVPLSKAPYSPNICSPGAVHVKLSCSNAIGSRGPIAVAVPEVAALQRGKGGPQLKMSLVSRSSSSPLLSRCHLFATFSSQPCHSAVDFVCQIILLLLCFTEQEH